MDATIHDTPSITQSQPNPSTSSNPLDPTDSANNKRSSPDSPEGLPATEKQTLRQIRRRNSLGDLTELKKTSYKETIDCPKEPCR